ncbi:MAG: alpha/beta fold hydrolase, partial [Lysobacterales bacterium]
DKVSKVAAMGANIRPDQGATEDWVSGMLMPVSEMIDEMIARKDESTDWSLQRQLFDLLITQPDISHEQLQSIQAPTLLVAGDMDIIRGEHTMEMFRNLRKGHLAILPGQTHWAPATDPDTFNAVIRNFFDSPFIRPTSQEILQKDLDGH